MSNTKRGLELKNVAAASAEININKDKNLSNKKLELIMYELLYKKTRDIAFEKVNESLSRLTSSF